MARYCYADPPYPEQAQRHYGAEAAAAGVLPGDDVVDLFPGSGSCQRAIDGYLGWVPMVAGTLWAEDVTPEG